MSKLLFEINKLHCFYKASKVPVLEINDFNIYSGERVFIIGQSGVGKSTILESLGLMNNTINNKNKDLNKKNLNATFNFKDESFLNIWDKGEENLRKKRNKNFSFIFQSNNLFKSMSGYQNIISGSLIGYYDDINKIKSKAAHIVRDLLPDLNLKDGKDFDIVKMSGGQRQRVSFARAIITGKDILFADEPTGNLDWYNADKLMKYLDEQLGEDRTAVVVTHDIEIALNFATKIIFIDKVQKNQDGVPHFFGRISNQTIYKKQDDKWHNQDNIMGKSAIRDELRNKFLPK
tara:strand:- start:7018 stop:7887 length:870 start_codon:yes stop_codon:yes gene_type:complete